MVAAAMLLGAAGCPAEPGPPSDVDGGAAIDAGHDGSIVGNAGLVFEWAARPKPVGNAGDRLTIEEIRLPLRHVRAIGDAAPGDSRTSVPSLELRWRDGDSPNPLVFGMAPPGLYSRFEFRVQDDGDSSGYEMRGEVMLGEGSEAIEFRIKDTQALPVSLPLTGLELEVGAMETVEVTVDVMAVLATVDWANAQIDDDKIELDEKSPEIVAIRAALASSFSARLIATP